MTIPAWETRVQTIFRRRSVVCVAAGQSRYVDVMIETSLILLVDRDGALLLQLRDEHAVLGPNQWGLPGGGVESGETPVEAAHRELFEETGLEGVSLELFWSGLRPYEAAIAEPITMHVFCARTDAVQGDIVLGEGQELAFIPENLVLERSLTVSAALLLPMFLASPEYAELRRS